MGVRAGVEPTPNFHAGPEVNRVAHCAAAAPLLEFSNYLSAMCCLVSTTENSTAQTRPSHCFWVYHSAVVNNFDLGAGTAVARGFDPCPLPLGTPACQETQTPN